MTILFKIFPQKSHLNATFRFANALRDLGHTTTYVGVEQMKEYVEAQGHQYITQTVDVYPYVENTKRCPKFGIKLIIRMFLQRYCGNSPVRDTLMRCDAFDAILKSYKPDLIFVDSPYVAFSLSILKHRTPFAIIESMVSLNRSVGCPPLDTAYVPTDNLKGRVLCWCHWRRYFVKRRMLGFLGLRADFDKRLVLKAARCAHLNVSNISFERYFHLGLKNVPELVLSPKQFDFPREKASNEIYIGPSVMMERRDSGSDYRFKGHFERVIKMSKAGIPLVYCSMGTAAWRYQGVARFLQRVLLASDGAPWNLILSIGTDFEPGQFRPNSENALVFQFVPQLEVLKYSNLMITHGGMNSITECVMSGVPMLIYPGTNQIDQPGNAARVEFHGLGMKGNMRSESIAGIQRKIVRVLGDKDFCRRTVQKGNLIKAEELSREAIGTLVDELAKTKSSDYCIKSEDPSALSL